MAPALKPTDFDVSKITYTEIRSLKNAKSKMVGVYYEGDRPTFQTPIMHMPYGVNDSSKIEGNDGPKKYDISLSFRGKDTESKDERMIKDARKLSEFFNVLLAIENKVKEDAFANRLTWFKKDYNGVKDIVNTLFTPIVKFDVDKETGEIKNQYPPTFRAKLPYDAVTDEFKFDALSMDKTVIDFKSILNSLKGSKCQAIVQLGGIWFAGGRFGCTWRVETAKFGVQQKSKFDFVDDSDDEDDDAKTESDADIAEDALAVIANTTLVEDSDKEDEEEEEEEEEEEDSDLEEDEPTPPPPPPPAPKKTKAAIAAAAAAAAAVAATVPTTKKSKK